MHQDIFRLNYIIDNDAYFLDLRAQKIPLIFFYFKSFLTATSPAFWGSKI